MANELNKEFYPERLEKVIPFDAYDFMEKQRLEIGEYLVKECDAKAYKASFEDEGASFEDISRAKIITEKVGLNLDIKVGGCEAIANIREAKILGARAIIGPMIETPYAMRKFIGAVKKVYDKEELDDIDLGVNIETITGANNFEEILDVINEEKDSKIREIQDKKGPVICEIFVSPEQNFEPKCQARRLEDGTMVSSPLEDLAPFLSREELKENMIIPLVGE